MAVVAAPAFLKTAPAEKLKPVYVLAGAEDYFRAEAKNAVIARVRAEDKDADVRRLDRAACDDFEALATEARLTSMWSPRQVLVFTPDKRFLKTEAAAWEKYLAAPNPASHVVFDWPDPDERITFAKLLKSEAQKAGGAVAWVACAPLREGDLRTWLDARARERGMRFAPGALEYLLDTCGAHLSLLAHEMDKALLYQPDAKTFTREALQAVAAGARAFAWYDLTDAIGARRADGALRILKELLDSGENAVGLLTVVAGHLRRLLHASALAGQGLDDHAVLQTVGVRFYGDKFMRQVRAFRTVELERAIAACFETDRALKSSGMPPRLVIERFVLSLVRRPT